MAEISPVGVLGDPTNASAEAGYALEAAADPVYLEIVREALGGARSRKRARNRRRGRARPEKAAAQGTSPG